MNYEQTIAETKERPILFSGPMVRAIMEGRKTQTRRIIKPVRGFEHHNILKVGMPYAADPWAVWWHGPVTDVVGCLQECPHGKPGDRLWVRESLVRSDQDLWLYAADRGVVTLDQADETAMLVWAHHKKQDYCLSIHMPRWASRITLELTGVKVEKLEDISEEDARMEGFVATPWQQWYRGRKPLSDGSTAWQQCRGTPPEDWIDVEPLESDYDPLHTSAIEGFRDTWNQINGKTHPWGSRPHVWVETFRVVL